MIDEAQDPGLPDDQKSALGGTCAGIAAASGAALVLLRQRTLMVLSDTPDASLREHCHTLLEEAASLNASMGNLATLLSSLPAFAITKPATTACAHESLRELRSAIEALEAALGIEHRAPDPPQLRVVRSPE